MRNITLLAILVSICLGQLVPVLVSAATAPVMKQPIAACVLGKPQITISWNNVGATSYAVLRLEKPQTQWLTRYSLVRSTTQVDKYVKNKVTYQYQVKANFGTSTTTSNIVTVTTPDCTSTTNTASPATSTSTQIPSGSTFSAYITGYGWPDNTPPSAEISHPVIHSSAGGIGTFSDPITIAVGHTILNGKDILDYPAGTKFYIPALRRYFIVEDSCGDGSAPQNGPCHTGHQGHPWLDAWVGGTLEAASATFACENKITGLHTVIQNPPSNYPVISGAIFGSSCTALYSETVSTL